jgi:pimeloyl-ACP methyl ester carboxylesterase
MMLAPLFLDLGDGRRLAYALLGADAAEAAGCLAVQLHGFPSSRLEALLFHRAARARGVVLLGVDRPGYGHSTPDPAHTIDGFVRNELALLVGKVARDLWGEDAWTRVRLALLAVSGGGPYVGAALRAWTGSSPDGLPVPRAAVFASAMAPCLGNPGSFRTLSWAASMQFGVFYYLPKLLIRRISGLNRWMLLPLASAYLAETATPEQKEGVRRKLKGFLPTADYQALTRDGEDDQLGIFLRFAMEAYVQPYEDFCSACADTAKQLCAPTDYTLSDIRVRTAEKQEGTWVTIFQGGKDMQVPPEVGRMMAEGMQGAEYRLLAEESHVSLLINHADDIIAAACK